MDEFFRCFPRYESNMSIMNFRFFLKTYNVLVTIWDFIDFSIPNYFNDLQAQKQQQPYFMLIELSL